VENCSLLQPEHKCFPHAALAILYTSFYLMLICFWINSAVTHMYSIQSPHSVTRFPFTSLNMPCKNWLIYDEYGLLHYNAVYFRDSSTFSRNISPPSSGPKGKPSKKQKHAAKRSSIRNTLRHNPETVLSIVTVLRTTNTSWIIKPLLRSVFHVYEYESLNKLTQMDTRSGVLSVCPSGRMFHAQSSTTDVSECW
jgi:hypothetical protein